MIAAIKDVMTADPGFALALSGLVLGIAFGWVVQATNFCAMGAVADLVLLGDGRRMRSWLLAIGIAVLASHALAAVGITGLQRSIYLTPRLAWVGNIVGGLLFGIGMVLAGGCTSRNLARVGSGDLRALATLAVLGLVGSLAAAGVLAPVRHALEQAAVIDLARFGFATQGMAELMGLGGPRGAVVVALPIGLGIVAVALASAGLRASRAHVLSGTLIGLLVAGGWLLTGLAYDELALKPVPAASLTFVGPAADVVGLLQGRLPASWPQLGLGVLLGTVLGAGAASVHLGRFRWQGYSDAADVVRNLLGAALMGFGGVTAMGCTMGQGVTGLSTLAVGSLLTFAALVAGGVVGLRLLERLVEA